MSRVTTVSSRLVAGTIAALVLAACSSVSDDSNTRSMTPTDPSLSVSEFNTQRHLFHTKDFYARPGGGGGGRGTGIYYHGGTVIAGPAVTKVVAIYWAAGQIYASQPTGTGGGGSDNSLIGKFLNHLGGSSYFNINTTYYNAGGSKVLNQVQYTSYWSTGAAPGTTSPTDQDMVTLIDNGFKSGSIAYDPNTVYAIFTGNGINLGGGFGSQYCAYHTRGTTSRGLVYFAAMPYNQQYPNNCTSALASPNADVAGNSEVNTLAHEIEETTTDARGDAWFDNRGYENADKCAWIWGATQTAANGGKWNVQFSDNNVYLIQQNWVNAGSGGCASSY